MTDIVERLRRRWDEDCALAAAEIERLQDVVKRLHLERREFKAEINRLRHLTRVLLDNDPNTPIADNGMTVLDGWREDAKRILP